MILSVLQAVGLFLATNIDDIIVLSLFFARGADGAQRISPELFTELPQVAWSG